MSFKSLVILGLQFLKHMLLRVLRLHKAGGSTRFLANYADDGITPVDDVFAENVSGWQRCTGCGLCDLACPVTGETVGGAAFSIASLARTAWRDTTVAPLVREAAQLFQERGDAEACEAACPEAVPLGALGRYLAG